MPSLFVCMSVGAILPLFVHRITLSTCDIPDNSMYSDLECYNEGPRIPSTEAKETTLITYN